MTVARTTVMCTMRVRGRLRRALALSALLGVAAAAHPSREHRLLKVAGTTLDTTAVPGIPERHWTRRLWSWTSAEGEQRQWYAVFSPGVDADTVCYHCTSPFCPTCCSGKVVLSI